MHKGPSPFDLSRLGVGGNWRNLDVWLNSDCEVRDSLCRTIQLDSGFAKVYGYIPHYDLLPRIIVERLEAPDSIKFLVPPCVGAASVKWVQEENDQGELVWRSQIDEGMWKSWVENDTPNNLIKAFHTQNNDVWTYNLVEGESLRVHHVWGAMAALMKQGSAFDPYYHVRNGTIDSLRDCWSENDQWQAPGVFLASEHENVAIASVDIKIPATPAPPSAEQLVFNGLFRRSQGVVSALPSDWLPSPGDTVGVAVGYLETMPGPIGYRIHDISTWQGTCMNHPLKAPKPVCTGDDSDRNFDFKIVADTSKYIWRTIYREEYLRGVIDSGDLMKMYRSTFAEKKPVYTQCAYEVRRLENAQFDTLWLVAQDYAAHCIVIPRRPGKIVRQMNARTDRDGHAIRSISLPTDDDGYWNGEANFGDYMADAWENSVLSPLYPVWYTDADANKAVLNFTPFGYFGESQYTLPDSTVLTLDHSTADADYMPSTRTAKVPSSAGDSTYVRLLGDRLCNFTEYRGFMASAFNDTIYPSPVHIRTNPFNHSVAIAFHSGLSDLFRQQSVKIPAQELPPAEFFLIPEYEVKGAETIWRSDFQKPVTVNMVGASRLYYSYPQPSRMPFAPHGISELPERQNFLLYVDEDEVEDEIGFIRRYEQKFGKHPLGVSVAGIGNLGIGNNSGWTFWNDSLHSQNDSLPAQVEYLRGIARIIISEEMIDTMFSRQYYTLNPDSILPTRIWLYNHLIGHEGGHTLMMRHQSDSTLMQSPLLIDYNNGGEILRFLNVYSDSSKAQFGIRRPTYWNEEAEERAIPKLNTLRSK